jgi:hypothetical protein
MVVAPLRRCAVAAVEAVGEVAEGGYDVGGASGVDLGVVFTVGDVLDPVEPVLDSPVPADVGGELFRGCFVGGSEVITNRCSLVSCPVLWLRRSRVSRMVCFAWGKSIQAWAGWQVIAQVVVRPWLFSLRLC